MNVSQLQIKAHTHRGAESYNFPFFELKFRVFQNFPVESGIIKVGLKMDLNIIPGS